MDRSESPKERGRTPAAQESDRELTKEELADEATGDETGGERRGRGAPSDQPEQFEEYTGTERQPDADEEHPARTPQQR